MGATQSSTEAAESPTSSSRGLGLGAVGDAVDRWFDVSTDYVCGPNSCSCLLDDGADGSFTVSQASITVVSADGRTDTFGPTEDAPARASAAAFDDDAYGEEYRTLVLGEAAPRGGPAVERIDAPPEIIDDADEPPPARAAPSPRAAAKKPRAAPKAAAPPPAKAAPPAAAREAAATPIAKPAATPPSPKAKPPAPPAPAPPPAAAARRSPAATPKAGPKPAPEIEVNLVRVKRSLRKGIPFVKHCSDLRKRDRVLCLNRAETRVGWKRGQPETTMVSLRDIDAVRMASEVDPAASLLKPVAGTHILRQTADGPTIMKRAFSLVLVDRTLDIECGSELEARTLCAAFKVMVRDEKVKYGDIAG